MIKYLFFTAALVLGHVLSAQENFRNEWQKMHDSKSEALVEFNEAKFGMFIHWGVYSVPAGIWNDKEIPGIGEWIMYRARIPREEYKALSAQFNPTGFDAEEWVKIAKNAGMKYIVCMPKHHDGFAMYRSEVSDYNIYDTTPFKRDPIDELYKACKKFGLKFGFYYSHATDWMDGGDAGVADFMQEIKDGKRDASEHKKRGGRDLWPANDWDPSPVKFQDYIKNKALPQVNELMERYPDVMEVWYDMQRYTQAEDCFRFYELVYKHNPKTLINSRIGGEMGDFWIPGDNRIPGNEHSNDKIYWETPGTLNNTWGYKSYDLQWKTSRELIFWISEIASKGGNYLLNVGPDEKGIIPEESVTVLKEIGQWMKVNGEAIYGTSEWKIRKEGPSNIAIEGTQERAKMKEKFVFTNEDFWFTQKGNKLYIISLSTQTDGKVSKAIVKSVNPKELNIESIEVLGSSKKLEWNKASDALHVESFLTNSPLGYVLKITLSK